MDDIRIPERMHGAAAKRLEPFVKDLFKWPRSSEAIHSLYVYGSAITADYIEKTSDINSIVVLNGMDFDFLRHVASLGKDYKKSSMAPPLVMTPAYIEDSLDVFPVEFLNLRVNHACLSGTDILGSITVEKNFLRLQCEREIKTMLIRLRQGYITSGGNADLLAVILHKSINGLIAVFRAIAFLKDAEPSPLKREAVAEVERLMGISNGGRTFMRVLDLRDPGSAPPKGELPSLFERYYNEVDRLSKGVDELSY